MKSNYKHLYWLFVLVAAFLFDQMFWEKPAGINLFIFTCLAILAGLVPMWMDKIRIPWQSYLLLLPILFFSSALFWRSEPFTTFANSLILVGSMALFATTLLNGAWMQHRLQEHFTNTLKLLFHCFIGGIAFFIQIKQNQPEYNESISEEIGETQTQQKNETEEKIDTTDLKTTGHQDKAENSGKEPQENRKAHRKQKMKKIAPFLRGLLITLPILAVLAGLLAAADPVFSDQMINLFDWFRIENLDELLFRMFYSLLIAYVLLSAIFHALSESKEQPKPDAKPLFKPFLGHIEANMVLVSVNLLFLIFVIIQFTYLFGGTSNISAQGYTYSEYARRGFFELLAVAILSLLLFYSLSTITKRETKSRRWTFSILGVLLVSQLAIILVSAFTRLNLYEEAYGFTRLRTVTHVFIIWIGLLLTATAVLEIANRLQKLALVLIFFTFGYGLSLNLLNVDQFIVDQNISRVIQSEKNEDPIKLDTGYLYSLSYDSIPPLIAYYEDPNISENLRYQIGAVLACRLYTLDLERNEPLTSYHHARAKAIAALNGQIYALEDYEIIQENYSYYIVEGNDMIPCSESGW